MGTYYLVMVFINQSVIRHLVRSSGMSLHLAKSVRLSVHLSIRPLPLAKTAAKWPKMIRFRIFKCLWNHLD